METHERFDLYVRLLSDPLPSARRHALVWLRTAWGLRAPILDRVVEMTSDPSADVRQEAAWILLQGGHAHQVPAGVFADLFRSPSEERRVGACKLASSCHIPLLVDLVLKDSRTPVRKEAADALVAQLPHEDAVEAIFKVLGTSASLFEVPQVFQILDHLAVQLGRHADVPAVGNRIFLHLRGGAAPRNLHARWVEALAPRASVDEITQKLLFEILGNSKHLPAARIAAARGLAALQAAPAWRAVIAFACDSDDPQVYYLAEQLAHDLSHRDRARERVALIGALGARDPLRSMRAAQLLGRSAGLRRVRGALVERLRDERADLDTLRCAARALVRAGRVSDLLDSKVLFRFPTLLNDVEILRACEGFEVGWVVRCAVLAPCPSHPLLQHARHLLGPVVTDDVATHLIGLYGQAIPSPDMQVAIVQLLGRLLPCWKLREPYLGFLLGLLEQPQPVQVQRAAVEALADLAREAGVRPRMVRLLGLESCGSSDVQDDLLGLLARKADEPKDPDRPAHGDERPRRRARARPARNPPAR